MPISIHTHAHTQPWSSNGGLLWGGRWCVTHTDVHTRACSSQTFLYNWDTRWQGHPRPAAGAGQQRACCVDTGPPGRGMSSEGSSPHRARPGPGRQTQSCPVTTPLIKRGQEPEYLRGNFPIFQYRLKFLKTCLGQTTYVWKMGGSRISVLALL